MKTIDTLVEDLYNIFKQPQVVDEALAKAMGNGIADIVKLRLEGREREQYLRMSNIGKPDRQVWYDLNSPPADKEELQPQTYLKFMFGDIWEQVLLTLCEVAGHTVTHKQAEVEIEGVPGHPDAIIDGVVVDVKSCSQYAFKKFENGTLRDDDAFGYIAQLAAYVEALTPGKEGAFLAVDKSSGALCLMKVSSEELVAYNVREEAKRKQAIVKGPIPDRCYPPVEDGKSGNLKLSVGCSYCGYKFKCWDDVNEGKGLRTFIYSNGPRFLVNVEREPDVYEVGKDNNWERS